MTSTTGSDEHPEVTEISALAEGLLPPDRGGAVRRHLHDCALCADVRDSLEEIRSLLGTLPGPARMPSDVAERIDAALAAEALLDATSPTGPPVSPVAEPEGATDPVPSRPAPVSRETATVATGEPDVEPAPAAGDPAARPDDRPVDRPADRPAGRPRAASGPGRKAPRRGGGREGARRWPKVLLGTAYAAAVIGVGTLLVQSSGSDGTGGGPNTAAAGTDKAESRSLASADLEHRVRSLLAEGHADNSEKTTGGRPSDEAATQRSSENTPLRAPDEEGVPSCVQAGTGRSETPLAADQDVYDGTRVYIVVLPHPSDSSLVDAFVIDSSCTTATPPAAGAQLLTRTYPRD